MDLEECVKLGRELESRLADVNRLEQLKLSLEGMVEVVSHMRDEDSSILSLAAASHGKEDLAIMISAAKRIVLNRNIDTLKRAIDEGVATLLLDTMSLDEKTALKCNIERSMMFNCLTDCSEVLEVLDDSISGDFEKMAREEVFFNVSESQQHNAEKSTKEMVKDKNLKIGRISPVKRGK